MTTIYLKEDAKIEIDGYNHTLMKFIPGGKETKVGGKDVITKDRWDTLGYYPNIEQAVRALVTRFQDYDLLPSLEAYANMVESELKQIKDKVKVEL